MCLWSFFGFNYFFVTFSTSEQYCRNYCYIRGPLSQIYGVVFQRPALANTRGNFHVFILLFYFATTYCFAVSPPIAYQPICVWCRYDVYDPLQGAIFSAYLCKFTGTHIVSSLFVLVALFFANCFIAEIYIKIHSQPWNNVFNHMITIASCLILFWVCWTFILVL